MQKTWPGVLREVRLSLGSSTCSACVPRLDAPPDRTGVVAGTDAPNQSAVRHRAPYGNAFPVVRSRARPAFHQGGGAERRFAFTPAPDQRRPDFDSAIHAQASALVEWVRSAVPVNERRRVIIDIRETSRRAELGQGQRCRGARGQPPRQSTVVLRRTTASRQQQGHHRESPGYPR